MLTPTSGTLADYNAAVLAGSQTHARLVFPVQNVTLTDNDISINGGVARTSILNPEEDLVFGRAVMDELQIRLLNGSVFNGFDWTEEFHIDFGVEMNGTTNWVTTGYFKGKKPKRTIRTDTIDFTAYDRMQAFDILADEFLANEVFPITMEDLYHDLCTYCGVNYAVGDEMADSMALTYAEDPFADGITCRMILAWIAEANCCTAKINAAGEVVLKWYTDQTGNYSLSENKYFDIDIDENTVPVMDSVRISSTDAGIAGFMYPVIGTNPYEIIDNPLLMFLSTADKTTVITNIVARFTAFGTYVPISVNPIANWMVETGDIIEIQYDNGSTMSMPVFNKTFEWAGMGVDYYECVGNSERQTAAESAKDEYVLGGKLSDKYTIQSGIDINENGIDVSGNKYVRIRSGGVLDVDSQNFKLNSTDRTMMSGNWHFFDGGMYRQDEGEQNLTRLFEIGEASGESADFQLFLRTAFMERHPLSGTDLYYAVLDIMPRGTNGFRFSNIFGDNDLEPNDNGDPVFGGTFPAFVPMVHNDGSIGCGGYWFKRGYIANMFSRQYGLHTENEKRDTSNNAFVTLQEYTQLIDGNKYYKGRFVFGEKRLDSDGHKAYCEYYKLPIPDGDAINDATYDIQTTKDYVGIKRITKFIAANTNTCRVDFPSGAWLLNFSLPGINKQWLGLVYCGSDNNVAVQQINSSTGVVLTGNANSYGTFTFTQTNDQTVSLLAIPLRGTTYPSFH